MYSCQGNLAPILVLAYKWSNNTSFPGQVETRICCANTQIGSQQCSHKLSTYSHPFGVNQGFWGSGVRQVVILFTVLYLVQHGCLSDRSTVKNLVLFQSYDVKEFRVSIGSNLRPLIFNILINYIFNLIELNHLWFADDAIFFRKTCQKLFYPSI